MAGGSTPDRGPHQKEIQRAIKWLEDVRRRDGWIEKHDVTGMGPGFEHACSTLLLAHIYGMDPKIDELKREHLSKALDLLETHQSSDGGWGPQGKGSSDIGVTAMAYLAIRAAQACGVARNKASLEKLQEYIDAAASSGSSERIYTVASALRVSYGLRGPDDKSRTLARSLMRMKYGQDHGKVSEWDYMAAFYSVGALMHDEKSAEWKEWYGYTRKFLVAIQHPEGFWIIEYCLQCKVFATALALLSLQMPTRILPFHQY